MYFGRSSTFDAPRRNGVALEFSLSRSIHWDAKAFLQANAEDKLGDLLLLRLHKISKNTSQY